MSSSVIVIPTYNEKENIEKIVEAIFKLPTQFEIVIIDDNSPDGTGAIVHSMIERWGDKLHIIEREGKLGLGTAYITGFKWALERGYRYIFEMDADFSHDPNSLLDLHRACLDDNADIAIGSRYISGVNVVNWPLGRVLLSYGASMYVRVLTGMDIMDTTAGFKCYRREVLETMDLDSIRLKGYGFQIEMKFTAWRLGFNIVEVPIIFTDRKQGTSKMSGGIFNEALFGVFNMKIRSLFCKPKKRNIETKKL